MILNKQKNINSKKKNKCKKFIKEQHKKISQKKYTINNLSIKIINKIVPIKHINRNLSKILLLYHIFQKCYLEIFLVFHTIIMVKNKTFYYLQLQILILKILIMNLNKNIIRLYIKQIVLLIYISYYILINFYNYMMMNIIKNFRIV